MRWHLLLYRKSWTGSRCYVYLCEWFIGLPGGSLVQLGASLDVKRAFCDCVSLIPGLGRYSTVFQYRLWPTTPGVARVDWVRVILCYVKHLMLYIICSILIINQSKKRSVFEACLMFWDFGTVLQHVLHDNTFRAIITYNFWVFYN